MLTGTVHEVVVNPREELRGRGGGGYDIITACHMTSKQSERWILGSLFRA